MVAFPLEHVGECLPHTPCVCCRAVALLRTSLNEAAYQQFLDYAQRAHVGDPEGVAEDAAGASLSSPWEPFLELSVRTTSCLKNEGLRTFADILARSEAELFRIPNFGRKSLKELKEALGMHGFRIGHIE